MKHLRLVNCDEEDLVRAEDEDLRAENRVFPRGRSILDDYRPKHIHSIEEWSKRRTSATESAKLLISGSLERATADAQDLLALGDDWDGEGALAISAETVGRALSILRSALESVGVDYLLRLLNPDITPLSNGSVDLYWKTSNFTLLINVSSVPGASAGFYGSNLATGYDVRGQIRTDAQNLRFLNWLVE
jgi:hypothetical protein